MCRRLAESATCTFFFFGSRFMKARPSDSRPAALRAPRRPHVHCAGLQTWLAWPHPSYTYIKPRGGQQNMTTLQCLSDTPESPELAARLFAGTRSPRDCFSSDTRVLGEAPLGRSSLLCACLCRTPTGGI